MGESITTGIIGGIAGVALGFAGAAIVSAVLLGALQVVEPNARAILSQELSSIGSSRVEPSQIAPALMAAYRWVFFALGGLSGCAAVVAWSIPNLDWRALRPVR